MGAIEKKRMRRVPGAKTSWFSRKESSKPPVSVFSFGKVNPHPSLSRYEPSSPGIHHEWKQVNCLRSDWIPQCRGEAFIPGPAGLSFLQ